MNRFTTLAIGLVMALAMVSNFATFAVATPPFWTNQKPYENGIPIGTKITTSNWQKYQDFMDPGLIELFKGTSFWHMPPDFEIDVGPTWPAPLPKPYVEDTEKYSSQTKLVKTEEGGYYPTNLVAGLPFPNPTAGDPATVGARLFWNILYQPHARLEQNLSCSYTEDSRANWTQTSVTNIIFSRLSHLSDPPYPITIPNNNDTLFSAYLEEISPEQAKYFTLLYLYSQNPTTPTELYEYVPSLRRSLRLSQAARCAPVFGTDIDNEDANNGLPFNGDLFKIDYLGVKKTLLMMHADPESLKSCGTATTPDPKYNYISKEKGVMPMPRPGRGQWEVRDEYVIEMKRLPQFNQGYCYGNRRIYVDKESDTTYLVDLWDNSNKLYKWSFEVVHPSEMGRLGLNGQYYAWDGPGAFYVANFLDGHVTYFPGNEPLCVDNDCPSAYFDITRYASPQGLMKILQ